MLQTLLESKRAGELLASLSLPRARSSHAHQLGGVIQAQQQSHLAGAMQLQHAQSQAQAGQYHAQLQHAQAQAQAAAAPGTESLPVQALAFQCVASSAWVVGELLMGLSGPAEVFRFVAAVAWTIGNVCAAHGMGWFNLCAGHRKGTGPAETPSQRTGPAETPSPGSRSWRRLQNGMKAAAAFSAGPSPSGQGFGGGGDAVAKSVPKSVSAPSLELTEP